MNIKFYNNMDLKFLLKSDHHLTKDYAARRNSYFKHIQIARKPEKICLKNILKTQNIFTVNFETDK